MSSHATLQKISQALVFASIKHKFQRRKDIDQTPYINHPIGVMNNLISIGGISDEDILIAGLLHDTVEDTQTTNEELIEVFGERIARIVMECTDDKSIPKAERKRLQVVNASHKSYEASLVKLSDKLYNLTDLLTNPPPTWSQERIDAYFAWARQVTDQLVHVNEDLAIALERVYIKKRSMDALKDIYKS